MAPTRLPASVRIGVFTFRIDKSEAFHKEAIVLAKDGVRGICDIDELVIHVKPGMPRAIEQEVVLHELYHACFFAAGQPPLDETDEPEELFIACTSPSFLGMMRDNPRLVAYLLEV